MVHLPLTVEFTARLRLPLRILRDFSPFSGGLRGGGVL
jgi:hypothetical protein